MPVPDHHPDVVVVVGLGEELAQQHEHLAGDGVASVGPVEGDGGDVVGHVVEDLGAVALVGFGAWGVGHDPTR
jgi:hypothetical protein